MQWVDRYIIVLTKEIPVAIRPYVGLDRLYSYFSDLYEHATPCATFVPMTPCVAFDVALCDIKRTAP